MTKLEFDKSYYLNVKMQPLAGTSFINWLRLLAENKFKIDWQFIPKALYVTFMISLFTPFRIYEKLKFDRIVEKERLPQIIFIIGHFRSGTTFLHYLMGQDKNLAYVSTRQTMAPWVFLTGEKFFKKIVEEHLPEKRPMDDLEMKADLPYEDEYALANFTPYSFYHGWYFPHRIHYYLRRYVLFENVDEKVKEEWKETYAYLLKKISYRYGGKPILLKSLVNTGRIKLLLEAFPEAKFIHIYRDPYKVYLSTWRLYESIIPIFSFQHVEREFIDRLIIDFYKSIYEKYFEEKRLIPKENLVEIRYEDFVKNPLKSLREIYDKLDLSWFEDARPGFERYLARYKNYKPHTYKIDDELKKKIDKEWGFVFKKLEYKF